MKTVGICLSDTPRTLAGCGQGRIAPERNGEVKVSSSQVAYICPGGRQHQFAGGCQHVLRQEAGGWRIKHKQVFLLANDAPVDPNSHLVIATKKELIHV